LAENADKLGQLFRKELAEKLNPEVIENVRGKGLLNAIIVNSQKGIHIIYAYITGRFKYQVIILESGVFYK